MTALKGKGRRSEEFWKKQIEGWRLSGLSKKRFCSLENLSYWAFRERLKKHDFKMNDNRGFVKLDSMEAAVNRGTNSIDLLIHGTITIRLTPGFDGELLRSIIQELGAGV